MLTNKILNANVDPSAIGGTYTWSAESCTCTTACADVSFTSTTGTVIGTNFSTTVTYPDDCTSVIIKLTIITIEGEEQCVSTFFYNIVNELGGTQLTWSCQSNEVGCMQIPSENQIFETQYDCLNCATCPCSTSNVCQDATFQAAYDCITHELTITSANQLSWCTVPYPVIETVDIVLNFTQGNYTHTETVNLACNTALPLVIDLTANPLPEGFYYIHVIMQLNGCQINLDSVEVDCPGGGAGPFNVGCCAYNSGNDSYTLGQGQPPVVYTAGLTMPMVSDLIIDFYSLVEADKLSVYSSWNNTLQTGTQIATTGYVGLCGHCCNTDYEPHKQGYYEHRYLGALDVPTESPYQSCNGGVLSGTATPVPSDFTFYNLSAGIARLILPAAYINTYAPSGTLFIVVFNNDGRTGTCPCGTIWEWRMFCGESCPCTAPQEPEIAITPAVCDVSPGVITILKGCQDTNGNPVIMQWSNDGVTWIDGEPLYIGLPALNAVTQTLYTRCVYQYDEACASDPVETDYIKPECCAENYNYTLECNPFTEGPYNQIDYQFHVIYEIPTCDDTENPAVVEQLYNTPDVNDGDFAYEVSFLGHSVILDVYFNSGSEFFFNVNCNLCWTPTYYIQPYESSFANLLATHACEPCDINLLPRFDVGSNSFYVSLDNDFGTTDVPSLSQGQPPYTLTITKNGVLTMAGITVSYNGTILNTGPIYLTTTLMPNLSGEYTIVGYYPVVPGLPPVRNTNINYGFFISVANPGQYVINITDHDNCIAETTICNITAEITSVFIDPETEWTVSIIPAFTITSYAWSLGDGLVLVSGELTDSTITTAGGGNLSVQVFTEECDPITADVYISECPTLEITSNSPSCKGDTIELYSDITYGDNICTGAIYTWTGVNGFTSTLANPTIPNGQSINVGTYYLTVTFSEPACKKCILTDTVIVNGFPLPNIPTGYTNANICAGTSITLTSINLNPCCNICTVNWYSALTGGTLLHTGVNYTTPVLNTTTTYYVTCESINGGCESTPRTPITVTVEPCCTTTMAVSDITTCLNTVGATLPLINTFTPSCPTGTITSITGLPVGWTFGGTSPTSYTVSYPIGTIVGTYPLSANYTCGICTNTTIFNVEITEATLPGNNDQLPDICL